MKTTQLSKALILVTIAAGMFAAGCELIVDFDRTKIPVEAIDAGGEIDAAGLGDGAVTNDGAATDDASDEASTDMDAGGDADVQDAPNDG